MAVRKSCFSNLYKLVLILLTGLLILGVLLLSSDIQFDLKERFFPSKVGVQVNIFPEGSKVYIDQKLKGVTPLFVELRGEHQLRVEREGYADFNQDVKVKQNVVEINGELVFIPTIAEIASNVTDFNVADNSIYYSISKDFYSVDAGTTRSTLLGEADHIISDFSILPGEGYMLFPVFGTYISELYLSPLPGIDPVLITDSLVAFSTGPDQGSYALVTRADEGTDLRLSIHNPEGGSESLSINLPGCFDHFSWSLTGKYLVIQTCEGIEIWERGQQFKRLERIKGAYYPLVSPTSDDHLVYIHQDGSLIRYDIPETKMFELKPGIHPPITWSPDGNSVIAMTYNAEASRTSLWAINLQTKIETLLADSSTIWGKVLDFQGSKDGKTIVYLIEGKRLFVLRLSE